jgi:hypothetical protein
VIVDEKNLSSLTLNEEVLIVNGVKQSDTLHKKFKNKYVKKGSQLSFYEN